MFSETLRKGLGRYAIGTKLRAMRLKKKMGLVERGRHSGALIGARSGRRRFGRQREVPRLARCATKFGPEVRMGDRDQCLCPLPQGETE